MLLTLTPGVRDDLSAFGSPPAENSYWIDGVNDDHRRWASADCLEEWIPRRLASAEI